MFSHSWEYLGINRLLLLQIIYNVFNKAANVNAMCCYLSLIAHICIHPVSFFVCFVEYALYLYDSSRLRCLSDMESKLAAVHSDIRNLRDTSAQANTSEEGFRELEDQWEEIHKTLSER